MDVNASVLAPQARQQWERVNDTGTGRPAEVLAELVLRHARAEPDRAAVVASTRTLTYRELALLAGRVAAQLRPGAAVGICFEPGWEQAVAVLAALLAGAPFVAVPPGDAASARWQRLASVGASTLLTQSWLDERLDWPSGCTIVPLDRVEPAAELPEPAAGTGPTSLACMLATHQKLITGIVPPEGSPLRHNARDHRGTGGGAVETVALTNDAVAGCVVDLAARLGIGAGDRVLAVSPLGDEVALFATVAPLVLGGALVVPDDIDLRTPAVWVDLMLREGVTVWHSPPALAAVLAEHLHGRGDDVPPSLRLVLLGGEPLPSSLVRGLRQLEQGERLRIVNLGAGGPVGPWATVLEAGELDPRRGHLPAGVPLADRRVYVLSETLAPCPVWVAGTVYLGGRGMPTGEWGSGERFLDAPAGLGVERLYRTDLTGRLLPDGTVDVVGDAATRISVQGHPLNLRDVEAAIATHEAVLGAAVVPSGEGSVAYVKAAPRASVTGSVLLDHLKRKMSPYLLPQRVELVSSFPLTTDGRVDRAVLTTMAAPAPVRTDDGAAGAPPKAASEDLLRQACELAARILGVPDVDPLMNLLDLGATSVQLVRLAVQAEQELGISADVEELLRFPSVTVLVSFAEVDEVEPVVDETNAVEDALILDPDEREAFKARRIALRRDLDAEPAVNLGTPSTDAASTDAARLAARRTHHAFARSAVPLPALADLLGALRQLSGNNGDGPKYAYPSAGGLYPVQAYLTVAPARVSGLAAGSYYYDPARHRLVRLDPDAELAASAHAWINRAAFRSSAFSIYLIGCFPAITPMYGTRARDYALIEAGAMCQLLMVTAAELGLGLCPVGELDAGSLTGALRLGDDHDVLHTLLGGMPPDEDAMLERLEGLR